MNGGESREGRPIRVCLVEDDPFFRGKMEVVLRNVSGFQCVGSFADGESALRAVLVRSPDIVVLDFGLPRMKGDEFLRRLKEVAPDIRVVVFTGIPDDSVLFDSLAAGADGFFYKDEVAPAKFLSELAAVQQGYCPLAHRARKVLLEQFRQTRANSVAWDSLTDREREVAKLLIDGLLNKEIAGKLSIGEGTVHSHVQHIYEKLHVHTRTEAAMKLWGIR